MIEPAIRTPAKLILICLAALLGLLACTAKIPEPPQPNLEGAAKIIKEHIHSKRAALTSNMGSSEHWGQYGIALQANEFLEDALLCYQQAHKLDSSDPKWPALTAVLLQDEPNGTALLWLESALKLEPNSAALNYFLGKLLENNGDYSNAIAAYQHAQSAARGNPAITFALGRSFFNQKEYEKSRSLLLDAMRLSPRSAIVRSYLLQLEKVTGTKIATLPTEAEADLTTPIEAPPPYQFEIDNESRTESGLRRMSLYYIDQQQWAVAENRLGLLTSHYPPTEGDLFNYALVLEKQQKTTAAKAQYKKLTELFPSNISAWLNLADVTLGNGSPDQAVYYYQQALDRAQSPSEKGRSLQGLGRIAAGKGKLEQALSDIQKAIQADSQSSILHMDAVRINADLKRFDRVRHHLAEAEKRGFKVDPAFKLQLEFVEKRTQQPDSPF